MSKRSSENKKSGSARAIQFAALPYRAKGKSELEVMLITSRDTGRWIIPKGWPKSGIPPHDAAAEEAFEEAGIAGEIKRTAYWFVLVQKINEKRKRHPMQRAGICAACNETT